MKKGNPIWSLIKAICKLVFKILLIILWTLLRLVEITLEHLNPFLKKLINNH